MPKFDKAYAVREDTVIPRALYVIGETANGETQYETEGVSYSAGDYVLEENITPNIRDAISSGRFDHILEEVDRDHAVEALGLVAVGTFAPEHEVEHEALVKAGHNIISEEDQLAADADAEDADEVLAAAKLANSEAHGGSSHRSGPGQFDSDGNKIITAGEIQYVEGEAKVNPFIEKAAKAAGDEDYSDMPVEKLEELAAERGLEVEGTGANGNVLKADLVAALEAAK